MDRVEQYADKLRAGCCCDNCLLLETEECSDCLHLSKWMGDYEYQQPLPQPLPHMYEDEPDEFLVF